MMGIRVIGTDGMIELGGDFKQALAYVKSIKGRKYDPAVKTWAVPVSIAKFINSGFPHDVLSGSGSGSHVTGSGNTYARNEWLAQKEINQVQSADYSSQIKAKYQKILAKAGCDPSHIEILLSYRLDDLLERGAVKFADPAREKQLLGIVEQYREEDYRASQKEDEDRDIQIEKILDKYGIE